MALETRHTEKSLLFTLLKLKKRNKILEELDDYNEAILQLMATMEQEDVVIVQKKVSELK